MSKIESMNFFILVLAACFAIFLFVVYFLSHDDFVILRRDVPMEKIYNNAIIFSLVTLFFSRLFYVIQNPHPIFLNPLGFILFPYFPGLSLSGGLLGGFLFLILLLKMGNLPVGRLLDFFSFAFLVAAPFGFAGYFLLSGERPSLEYLVSFILIISLVFLFARFILATSLSGKLKDGSLGILFLTTFSGTSLVINIILNGGFVLGLENIILILVALLCLIPLVKQEGYEWYQNYLRRR